MIAVTDSSETDSENEDSEDSFYVNSLIEEPFESDETTINKVNSRDGESDQWKETLYIGRSSVEVKLDTGADCNVLPKSIAKRLKTDIKQSRTKRLVSFSGHKIPVVGEIEVVCRTRNRRGITVFKIVEENTIPILGKHSCQHLGLIERVNAVNSEQHAEKLKLFDGLGCLKNFEYDLEFIENPKFKVIPARKIPHAIRPLVKKELDKMVKLGVIEPIKESTPAVSPLVIVQKKGKIRICMDPTELNKNIRRRHFPLKTVEEIAAKVNGAKFFTKLDCNKGFWQIKVTERSSKYLTFSTPWGRFRCLRLPFGVVSAPEVFAGSLTELLQHIENVEVAMDDILIYADTIEKLEKITNEVIKTLNEAGMTLNKEKCIFQAKELQFLGHIFSQNGMKPDSEKIHAIEKLKEPSNKKELQRLLGMVNYLNKFIPNLSSITEPMRQLLSKDRDWSWLEQQQQSFQTIKKTLSTAPVLKYYDVNLDVTLSVDASSFAIGACLLQDSQPVAYATKAFTKAQQNYPQIVKEALAIRVACKKFHQYIYGKRLFIETDHKPLEVIFKKPIYSAPLRLQKILLDVLPYDPKITYVKGSKLFIADTLSRDSAAIIEEDDEEEEYVQLILAMSDDAKTRYQQATLKDDELQSLTKVIQRGWPDSIKDVENCQLVKA